jgi:hypothetical protein
MPDEWSPSSYPNKRSTAEADHRAEAPPETIVSMYGGYANKGRVGQRYPTSFTTDEVRITAANNRASGVRKGSSVAGNLERDRSMQNVRYTERD